MNYSAGEWFTIGIHNVPSNIFQIKDNIKNETSRILKPALILFESNQVGICN